LQIWEFFLAYSTIVSREGGATCYQITLVKNINSTHRVNGIPTQFALTAALAKGKADIQANTTKGAKA
jgi:sphingolipid C9-methyltransferase